MSESDSHRIALQRALVERGDELPRIIEYYEKVESTSTKLGNLLSEGAPLGTVVAAVRQTDGRGRLGRTWFGGDGDNVCLSLAVPVPMPEELFMPLLPLAAGIAAAEVVRAAGIERAQLKWPNDLLVDGRKLAGILCEVKDPTRRPLPAVVGLGINVEAAEFPAAVAPIATSFTLLGRTGMSVVELEAEWILHFESILERMGRRGPARLIEHWQRLAEPFGRRVRVDGVEGHTVRLTNDGRLVVRCDDGGEIVVVGGVVE